MECVKVLLHKGAEVNKQGKVSVVWDYDMFTLMEDLLGVVNMLVTKLNYAHDTHA